MNKFFILLLMLFSFSAFSNSNLPPCGIGENDNPELDWNKAVDIKIDVAFIKDDAILCLGNIPGNPIDVKYVIYRDSAGVEKKFNLMDLQRGTMTLLTSEEISFGVVKKGKIITIQLERESAGIDFIDGVKYRVSLRFLRNLARLPFDPKDHRILEIDIFQQPDGSFYPNYNGTEFDQIKINISTPSLVIKEIDLQVNGNVDKTIITKKLREVNEL